MMCFCIIDLLSTDLSETLVSRSRFNISEHVYIFVPFIILNLELSKSDSLGRNFYYIWLIFVL